MSQHSINISYKKNLGKNYMIIDSANDFSEKNHYIRMLQENSMAHFLNAHVYYVNEVPNFEYDITGYQSLSVLLDSIPLSHTILHKLIITLYNSLMSIENYLLNFDHILLTPQCIYLSADYSIINFCYYPLKTYSFGESLKDLFDYLLKRVDHSDEKCVYLAYSLHKAALDEHLTMEAIYNFVSSKNVHYSDTAENQFSSEKIEPKWQDYPNESNNISTINNSHPDNNVNIISNSKSNRDRNFGHSSNNGNNINKNYNDDYIYKHDKNSIIKLTVLGIFSLLSFSISTVLYLLEYIPMEVFILIIIVTIIIITYNGYYLYQQYGRTKLQTVVENNMRKQACTIAENTVATSHKAADCNTVVLTGPQNSNCHKLIYSGITSSSTENSDMPGDIELTHYPFVIGKTNACDYILNNSAISRMHAKLTLPPPDNSSDDLFIEDLNSTNGTFINNIPLTSYEKYPLNSGDNITFGHLTYILR